MTDSLDFVSDVLDTRHYAGRAALFDGVSAVTFPAVTQH
jgi:hypothetical protein